jgi:hypothetical protein
MRNVERRLLLASLIATTACGNTTLTADSGLDGSNSADTSASVDADVSRDAGADVVLGRCETVGKPDAAIVNQCLGIGTFSVTVVGDASACVMDCLELCGPCVDCTTSGTCKLAGNTVSCTQGYCL